MTAWKLIYMHKHYFKRIYVLVYLILNIFSDGCVVVLKLFQIDSISSEVTRSSSCCNSFICHYKLKSS